MDELVHRYAPEHPAGRTAVAIVASLIGVPTLVLGLVGLSGNAAAGILLSAIGIATLTVAGQLTRGVVRQATAASRASPTGERTDDVSVEDPVETLQRRYAEGEIGDEEFHHRLDRLLESDEEDRSTAGESRLLE
ncbi:SHOCT domain-containing protein [Natrinema salaciae]|uniref:Short C-terminal domain-containing protein n=1 Tax=Natrinema salaciae TaxID=1186196 RepID=A0A1H9Q5S6_9EURY|nr:SHOCT domain-containing protein [Natrinema salaciae]SER55768.1 Short C-terminal domain-containing protein [Natrinema salaciae]